jgi:hypothetical protein
MGTVLRYLIAAAAILVLAARFFRPELQLDLTTFALIAVVLLIIFSRNIRIKALDLMGIKVEFDTVAATAPSERADIGPSETADITIHQGDALEPDLLDTYIERVIKLTPTEMIAPYIIISSILENFPRTAGTEVVRVSSPILLWIVFGAFLMFMPIYYYRILRPWSSIAKWQIVFFVVNFCGWALAIGGPFKYLAWYNPLYGALILTLTVFAMPVAFPSR